MAQLKIEYDGYFDIAPWIKKYPKFDKWLIINDRQCGKTVSSVNYAYNQYLENGDYFFLFRRTESLIKNAVKKQHYENINQNLTWTLGGIFTRKSLEKKEFGGGYSTGERVGSIESYNVPENFRGGNYDKYQTIIIDEITTETMRDYLNDEETKLQSVLTSVVSRGNKKVIMLGNASNFESPVFAMLGLSLKQMPSRGHMKFFPDRNLVVMYVGDNEFLRKKYEQGTLKGFSHGNKRYSNYAFGEVEWSLTNNIIINQKPDYQLNFMFNLIYMNNKIGWWKGQGNNMVYLSMKTGNGKTYAMHKMDMIYGYPYEFDTYSTLLKHWLRMEKVEVDCNIIQEILIEIVKKTK